MPGSLRPKDIIEASICCDSLGTLKVAGLISRYTGKMLPYAPGRPRLAGRADLARQLRRF